MNMKRVTAMLLVCGLCLSLISCGKLSDQTGQESATAVTESDAAVVSEAEDANYVYDYQVGMDPIPKEIADLGGPCQGTIHAFPSKIRMGLTQKRMEEDPELKAEVEKRIPEIEEYLAENIGGEFQVEGLFIVDETEWEFFCKEISSGYQFWFRFDNVQYYYRNEENVNIVYNNFYLEDYYEPQKTEKKKKDFDKMIAGSFGECCNVAWISGDSIELVTIRIALFTDQEIDKSEEQLKLLNLWTDLKEYNNDALYNICLIYYPTLYQEVMEKKFETGYLWDIGTTREVVQKLMQDGEIIAELRYDDLKGRKGNMGLDLLLERYNSKKYKKELIWPYWL